MPQAAAGAVYSWAFLAGAGAAAAGAAALTAFVVVSVAISVGLSALTQALVGKPKLGDIGPDSREFTVRGTVEPRQLIYGEVRSGGCIAFVATSHIDNKFLWFVVVYAAHECAAMTDHWIDSRKILSSEINPTTGLVTTAEFQNEGQSKLWIWRYLGTATDVANSALDSTFTEWTSAHRGYGLCKAVYRLERDDTVWASGPPQALFALIRGARLYDPRKDSTNSGSGSHRTANPSTWEWSRNAALALRDYVSGGTVVCNTSAPDKRLRFGEIDSRINDTETIASANTSDELVSIPGGTEARYTCDVQLSCLDVHKENLRVLRSACLANVEPVEGRYRIQVGAYDPPTVSITEDDVLGPVNVQTHPQGEDLYNLVTGTFYDEGRNWARSSFPPIGSSAYQADDGGVFPRAIELHATRGSYRAQRISALHLQQSRNKITVQFTALSPKAMNITQWDTFYASISEYGWVNKVFRCLDWEFIGNGLIAIAAREESAAAYVDLAPEAYKDPLFSSEPIFQVDSPEPPTDLRVVPQDDGVLFVWKPSRTPNVLYELEEAATQAMSSPTVAYVGADAQALVDKNDTTVRFYRVRAKNSGKYSSYEPPQGGMPSAAIAVTPGFRVVATPGSVTKIATGSVGVAPGVTVSPTNGTAPFTYSWARVSGDTAIQCNQPTSATSTFQRTGMAEGTTYTTTFRCTVTDNTTATATVDVVVTIGND